MSVRSVLRALGGLLLALPALADPLLSKLQRATPADRVVLVLNYLDTCRNLTQHHDRAFRLLDTVQTLARQTGDDRLDRYARFIRDTYAKHNTPSHAQNADLFLRVGKRAEADDPQIAAVCRHFAGQYFFLNNEYRRAFEHLLAANQVFRQIGPVQIPEFGRYLYELAFNYYHFGEYDKAIALLNETQRYRPYNANLAIQVHNTLGLSYIGRSYRTPDDRDRHRAERAFRQARQTAIAYGDSLWIGIVAGNMGNLYNSLNQWTASIPAYRINYAMTRRFGGDREGLSGVALRLARAFYELGRIDSCRFYIDLAERNLKQNQQWAFGRYINDEYERANYYDVLRLYHRATGNLPLAYRYLDSTTALRERINNRYNTRQVLLAEQKLQLQQHQSAVTTMERESQTQRLQFGALGLTLALLSLLFFLLYRGSRIRRRQEQLINAEREKSLRLQKQMVEDELRRARADLDAFVENLHQKNTLIDTITAELNERSLHDPPAERTDPHQHLLRASLLTNDDWDEFRERFERVHPNFFGQLKAQFTDISPAEQRLLALAKLHLDTRQMSRMLGISPDSIRKTKYRLRKKLGVGGHSSLLELLHEPTTAL